MAPANPIQLIAGLGNPGEKYAATRHNAGYWFADLVVQRCQEQWRRERRFFGEVARVQVAGHECRVIKPDTFMNRSGQSVGALAHFFRLEPQQILVVHDELDLPPGKVRLKHGGGHGGHNGLRDLHRILGPDYWRLRIGIGHPGHKSQVVSYVLKPPSVEDKTAIETAIARAAEELPGILAGDSAGVMNRLHAG
ncbi:MAG: aminoacyl-tRNA hydrolase [Pseudomonadota bacterium]